MVECEDSARPIDGSGLMTIQIPETVNCVSVDYPIAKTKQAIAFPPNLGDIRSDSIQASGIIRIRSSAVRRAIEFKRLTFFKLTHYPGAESSLLLHFRLLQAPEPHILRRG